MVSLAIMGHPRFRLSLLDVERPAPHYSSTAMAVLERRHPEHDWCFIMGADSLSDLPQWHEPRRLIALATLAVAGRPGAQPDMAEIERLVPGVSQRVRWVHAPLVDLSSTDVRRMAHRGASLRYLVPDAVATYIDENRLYEVTAEPPSPARA
jgi:nicotinate-nucleotide adenylyltransferase